MDITNKLDDDKVAHRSRFSDWTSIQNFSDVGQSNSLRQLYHQNDVEQRMSAVRKAIQHIRTNWGDYSTFMDGLRVYLEKHPFPDAPGESEQHLVNSILSVRRDWADRVSNVTKEKETFDLIRLYTSKFGYDHIFSMLNLAFRTDNLTENHDDLRSAVFFIELLNIELFNYLYIHPTAKFQGLVYRGVSFSKDQLQEFEDIARKPVRERHWAIPLSMMSASTNTDVALEFARNDTRTTHKPFLWRIHVAELDPELLRIYRERFPSSIVTSLCATPVHELSPFPEEEILLRGPFFQLLRIVEEVVREGEQAIPVMDLVMLDANRDHPSTMELGEAEDKARKLFAYLVGMGRNQVCKRFAMEYGLLDDAKVYEELYEDQSRKLDSLFL